MEQASSCKLLKNNYCICIKSDGRSSLTGWQSLLFPSPILFTIVVSSHSIWSYFLKHTISILRSKSARLHLHLLLFILSICSDSTCAVLLSIDIQRFRTCCSSFQESLRRRGGTNGSLHIYQYVAIWGPGSTLSHIEWKKIVVSLIVPKICTKNYADYIKCSRWLLKFLKYLVQTAQSQLQFIQSLSSERTNKCDKSEPKTTFPGCVELYLNEFSKFNPGMNPSMQAFGMADMDHGVALYH